MAQHAELIQKLIANTDVKNGHLDIAIAKVLGAVHPDAYWLNEFCPETGMASFDTPQNAAFQKRSDDHFFECGELLEFPDEMLTSEISFFGDAPRYSVDLSAVIDALPADLDFDLSRHSGTYQCRIGGYVAESPTAACAVAAAFLMSKG